MRKTTCRTLFASFVILLALAARPVLAAGPDGQTYRITITNLTKQQVLTPPILVSHRESLSLFTLAEPASPELAALAEGGNTQPLTALLGTLPEVFDLVNATGPIPPGSSIILEINSRGKFNRLSLAGMLATTNDGFFALSGVSFPTTRGAKSLTAVAYDAGSERNTEACSDVPGPPCAADSGNQRVTDGAEGFVHVHNGIHGVGDLSPAGLDWHNPKIQRQTPV